MPAAAVGSDPGTVRTHQAASRDRQSESKMSLSGLESQIHQRCVHFKPCVIHGRRPTMAIPIR